MATRKQHHLEITLPDEGRLLALKTVIGYEAGMRGLTSGQAFLQLIMDAADIDSYPEEVRSQIVEIQGQARQRGIDESLAAAGLLRSA